MLSLSLPAGMLVDHTSKTTKLYAFKPMELLYTDQGHVGDHGWGQQRGGILAVGRIRHSPWLRN